MDRRVPTRHEKEWTRRRTGRYGEGKSSVIPATIHDEKSQGKAREKPGETREKPGKAREKPGESQGKARKSQGKARGKPGESHGKAMEKPGKIQGKEENVGALTVRPNMF